MKSEPELITLLQQLLVGFLVVLLMSVTFFSEILANRHLGNIVYHAAHLLHFADEGLHARRQIQKTEVFMICTRLRHEIVFQSLGSL